VRGKESERVAAWGDLEGKERKEDSRLEPRYSTDVVVGARSTCTVPLWESTCHVAVAHTSSEA
jgi:hypothetical protein